MKKLESMEKSINSLTYKLNQALNIGETPPTQANRAGTFRVNEYVSNSKFRPRISYAAIRRIDPTKLRPFIVDKVKTEQGW